MLEDSRFFGHLEFPSDLCLAAAGSVLGICQSLHSLGERNALLARTEQKRHAQRAPCPR